MLLTRRCFYRWRGNKIRVGFAKGDYLQRLKAEWDEAAQAKEAAVAARKPSATVPYKARPSLRLRRRPGETDHEPVDRLHFLAPCC